MSCRSWRQRRCWILFLVWLLTGAVSGTGLEGDEDEAKGKVREGSKSGGQAGALMQAYRALVSPCDFFLIKDFIYLFIKRGEGREKEGEKHPCVIASHTAPTGTWPTTQACALTGS